VRLWLFCTRSCYKTPPQLIIVFLLIMCLKRLVKVDPCVRRLLCLKALYLHTCPFLFFEIFDAYKTKSRKRYRVIYVLLWRFECSKFSILATYASHKLCIYNYITKQQKCCEMFSSREFSDSISTQLHETRTRASHDFETLP
jgi:hypothetical protein